jgi:hypothetical protein
MQVSLGAGMLDGDRKLSSLIIENPKPICCSYGYIKIGYFS